MTAQPIILYDGVCGLCTGSVQFIIRRDPDAVFRFASLQSDVGRGLCREHGVDDTALDTMVLIAAGVAYTQSDAAVRIARHLRGPWRLAAACRLLPRPLRQWMYRLVARHRYRWFGRHPVCWLPDPDVTTRFIDTEAGVG